MVRDFSQKTVESLYETIRTNVDEEEQWRIFDFVEDLFMEELEIGDYINDINNYRLQMFDKHDVTTKKFDAIVEKAGNIDRNYAAQIEGCRKQLEAFAIKLRSVSAMLHPDMLALDPEKYAAELEAINTAYQSVKESREREQQEYEDELYEIEATWDEKLSDSATAILDKTEDYLKRSAECVVCGNFTDEVTLLGVGAQVALGIFDLDLPCDIRDIIADVKNIAEADEFEWELFGVLAIDVIGLLPVIGALKYADEAGALVKNADKLKYADETGEILSGGIKAADESIKSLDDALDNARQLEKELAGSKAAGDAVIESGLNSVDDIFTAGKKAFDNFDINNAYVKPKHLSTTGGNGQKFIGASKAEAESILKDALSNGKIVSISDNGLTKAGNASYEIIIDAGKIVGTKGENLVKIVISSDGGMLSAYPIK